MSELLDSWREKLDRVRPPRADAATGIPRIIHHIFFPGAANLPDQIAEHAEALQQLNPDWDYRFYDAATGEAFIRDTYGPKIFAAYKKIDPAYYAARADVLRYLLCYAVGGVYLDVKSAARLPLSEVIRDDDAFLLGQWEELRGLGQNTTHPSAHPELRSVQGFEYVQWFVVSAPGHLFLRHVIASVLANIDQYSVFSDGIGRHGVYRVTGPIAYTLAIDAVRTRAPHRFVRFEQDLGFAFSLFGDHKTHRTSAGAHYSQITLPIVRSNLWVTTFARLWFGPVRRNVNRAKRILRLR